MMLSLSHAIHAKIKSRLKSGNAICHQVQNRLFSSLLSKNIKTRIYRTVNFPVVLCGYDKREVIKTT